MTNPSRRAAIVGLSACPVLFSRLAFADQSLYLAERLAAYTAALTPADLNPEIIENAKFKFIDAIGCAIAALHETPIREIREIALGTPSNGATIWGTHRKSTMEQAAFVNGAATRYFDFNDAYAGKETGHPSDIIGGIVAAAEAGHRSGMDVLLAVVLAYEILCSFLDAMQISARGWDHPNYVLPAAALAAGKLMRLPPEKLTQAVNLSLSGHLAMNQTRSGLISNWKAMAGPEAVRGGIVAAQLARAGIAGPAPIFEGTAGFFKLVSGDLAINTGLLARNGGHFRILDSVIKFYPAQTQALTAISAAARIGRQIGDPGRISAIAVATTRAGMDYTANEPEKWAPKSSETADHSMPYIVVRALLDGSITPQSYEPAKLREPRVISLLGKLTVKEDPALTALYPGKVPNRVSVTLQDGTIVTEQVDELPGFVGKQMTRADVEDKFHRNAAGLLSGKQQKRFLNLAWSLERQPGMDALLASIVIPG